MRSSYSLRVHLVTFTVATLLPIIALTGVLLWRSAALERVQLESRLIELAEDLANFLDSDLDRQLTVLQTLSTLPALTAEDWPTFYAQAKAAVEEKAYVIVIDTSLRQLVNTLLPYGRAPAVTGDPETAKRILKDKQPAVSDLFSSLIDGSRVFNVNIPILRNGEVRHILILGHRADDLQPVVAGQHLSDEWIRTIVDRKGAIAVSSRAHQHLGGATNSPVAHDIKTPDKGVRRSLTPAGESVMRAIARSKLSGWSAVADLSNAAFNEPLRRSLRLWGTLTAIAFGLSATFAFLFARILARPMIAAANSATALAKDERVMPLRSHLSEANTIVAAQVRAQAELAERAAHQQLLANELSHRVKNVLAVVQSLVRRTLSDERSVGEARIVLTERLLALARAHEVLLRSDWKGASLREIVAAELAPFSTRVSISGPDLTIHGRMVQTFALVLHELATNAAKHGSLSDRNGKVSIVWSVVDTGPQARFRFCWAEKDGPSVGPPERKGFGSSLLVAAIPSDLDIKPRLAFEPDGFVYELDAPLRTLQADTLSVDP